LRIVDRELGELLAVQRHAGFLQSVDEGRVAHAAHPRRGVDADHPQPAELPLLRAAVARREGPGAQERLAHGAPQLRAAAAEALGLLEIARFLVLARCRDRDARHGFTIRLMIVDQVLFSTIRLRSPRLTSPVYGACMWPRPGWLHMALPCLLILK